MHRGQTWQEPVFLKNHVWDRGQAGWVKTALKEQHDMVWTPLTQKRRRTATPFIR